MDPKTAQKVQRALSTARVVLGPCGLLRKFKEPFNGGVSWTLDFCPVPRSPPRGGLGPVDFSESRHGALQWGLGGSWTLDFAKARIHGFSGGGLGGLQSDLSIAGYPSTNVVARRSHNASGSPAESRRRRRSLCCRDADALAAILGSNISTGGQRTSAGALSGCARGAYRMYLRPPPVLHYPLPPVAGARVLPRQG